MKRVLVFRLVLIALCSFAVAKPGIALDNTAGANNDHFRAACSATFTVSVDSLGVASFASMVSGGSAPYSYFWDFGDGNNSTFTNPTNAYGSPGSYSACLTIVDAVGCSYTHCAPVLIPGNGTNPLSVLAVDVQWPDTTFVNVSHPFQITVQNDSATVYNDSLFFYFEVDSGAGLNGVDLINVTSGSGIAGMDTVSFPLTHDFNSSRYAPGNNVVVIWPVNGSGEQGDSIQLDVYVIYPTSSQYLDISRYINVYPNPTTNSVIVDNRLNDDPVTYRIHSSGGKFVAGGKLTGNQIDLSELPSGMYSIELFSDSGRTIVKIIKY